MRRLAACAYSFSAALCFCVFLPQLPLPALFGPGCLILCAVCFLIPGRAGLALRLVTLGLGCGFLWFAVWSGLTLNRADTLVGERQTVQAVVLTAPENTTYGQAVDVRVNGVRCRLFLEDATGLLPGQRIRVTGRLCLSTERTGGEAALTYGQVLYAYADAPPEILGEVEALWRFYPARLGIALRRQIRLCFDTRTSAFLTAILTGDRTELKTDSYFYAMLRESGLAHMVAVSGMHLSFLVSFLYILLGKGPVSNAVCIPAILIFMVMTGCTPSAVRAGIMQIALCCSRLVMKEYDSHTALAVALALLLMLNPFSVRNAGLQLSFAATLGIVLFYTPIYAVLPKPPRDLPRRPGLRRKLLSYVTSSFAVSLAAGILTVPLTALIFSQFSAISLLSNLCALWIVSLCFLLGIAVTLLSFIWLPGARLAAYGVKWLVNLLHALVTVLGSLPVSSISTQNPLLTVWLCAAGVCIPVFRWLPGIRHRLRGYLIAAFCSLALFYLLGVRLANGDDLRTAVLDVGQGQCVAFTTRDHTVLVDCGGSGGDNAGDLAARYLHAIGHLHVDALILTHYHSDHANGVPELLRRMRVTTLYAPEPEADDNAAAALLADAEAAGTELCLVGSEFREVQMGALHLMLVPPFGSGTENERCLTAILTAGDFDAILTGDHDSEAEYMLTERLALPDAELLLAGHHGSKTAVSERLLNEAAPDLVVFSVGRNSYGLPSEAALRRASDSGAAIYRTDTGGNLIISYRCGEDIWAN